MGRKVESCHRVDTSPFFSFILLPVSTFNCFALRTATEGRSRCTLPPPKRAFYAHVVLGDDRWFSSAHAVHGIFLAVSHCIPMDPPLARSSYPSYSNPVFPVLRVSLAHSRGHASDTLVLLFSSHPPEGRGGPGAHAFHTSGTGVGWPRRMDARNHTRGMGEEGMERVQGG